MRLLSMSIVLSLLLSSPSAAVGARDLLAKISSHAHKDNAIRGLLSGGSLVTILGTIGIMGGAQWYAATRDRNCNASSDYPQLVRVYGDGTGDPYMCESSNGNRIPRGDYSNPSYWPLIGSGIIAGVGIIMLTAAGALHYCVPSQERE